MTVGLSNPSLHEESSIIRFCEQRLTGHCIRHAMPPPRRTAQCFRENSGKPAAKYTATGTVKDSPRGLGVGDFPFLYFSLSVLLILRVSQEQEIGELYMDGEH